MRTLQLRRTGTGAVDLPPESDVAAQLSSYSGTFSAQQVRDITAAYGSIRNNPAGVLAGAVLKAAQGGASPQALFEASSPIIATGLTALVASGGAAAPVIGLVALAYSIGSSLLSQLFSSGAQQCTWEVGGACFTGTPPWGPTDPQWTPIREWYDANKDVSPGFGHGYNADATLPGISQILCELDGLTGYVAGGGDPAFANFLRAYYYTWLANAEQAINGHPFVSYQAPASHGVSNWVAPEILLGNVITGWNANFSPAKTHTFSTSPANWKITPGAPCGPPGTYIDMIMAGVVTRGRNDPTKYVVNIGPQQPVPVHIPHLPPPGGSAGLGLLAKFNALTPPQKAITVVGGGAVAIAIGSGLYALATKQNYAAMWRHWLNKAKRSVR